jgi:septal ring factor EnvC (AmiA/AmiB activator)
VLVRCAAEVQQAQEQQLAQQQGEIAQLRCETAQQQGEIAQLRRELRGLQDSLAAVTRQQQGHTGLGTS